MGMDFDRVFLNNNGALAPLACWHIIYQMHDKYVHVTYALLNSAVIVSDRSALQYPPFNFSPPFIKCNSR